MSVPESLAKYLTTRDILGGKLADVLTDFVETHLHLVIEDPTNPDSFSETYEAYLALHTIDAFVELLRKKS